MALTWLANKATARGIRGTTELALDRGYVADAVALCSLQDRFVRAYCEHSNLKQLVGNAHRNKESGKIEYTFAGDVGNYLACIFEAKVTRSDFLATFGNGGRHKNRLTPVGALHWCVTPRGLVGPDEVPGFWGLLVPYGGGLSELKKPTIQILNEPDMDRIAHKLLWPLQACRGYIECKGCGRYTTAGYCSRCKMRGKKEIERK